MAAASWMCKKRKKYLKGHFSYSNICVLAQNPKLQYTGAL